MNKTTAGVLVAGALAMGAVGGAAIDNNEVEAQSYVDGDTYYKATFEPVTIEELEYNVKAAEQEYEGIKADYEAAIAESQKKLDAARADLADARNKGL